MYKRVKKLICYVVIISILCGMRFADTARALNYSYPAYYFGNSFNVNNDIQYVEVRANCDNYYSGYYYATAYCDDFYKTGSGSPNVTVFAPSKRRVGNLPNPGTLAATVISEDEYDMRYMSAVYAGAYVEFKGALHLMGASNTDILIRVKG